MDYKKAISIITARRSDELAAADAFFKELLSSSPEFRDAELAVRSAELEYAHGRLSEERLAALTAARDELIKKMNIASKLAPPPHCPKCGDTGRSNGAICSCVRQLAFSDRTDNLEFPVRSFSDIDVSLFQDEPFYLKVASELKTIAQKGDSAKRKNVNLLGKTGTGKTFLASCFAGECMEQGRSVTFITAFTFVSKALLFHTGFDAKKTEHLAPLLDSDVLIIDDLGTESIFKNVTLEYLYHVINERQLKGRTTLITSNLTIDQLAVRYGERIVSRLFDKKLCYCAEFDSRDLRKINI